MFVLVVPTAEDAGTTPELNASNAHIPLQWAALATREAGIGAGIARRNRILLADGTVNEHFQPEGEMLRAMANARLATLEMDVAQCPSYAVDLRQTDAATAEAFITLVNESAAKASPAEDDTAGQAKGKALKRLALSKVTEVLTA